MSENTYEKKKINIKEKVSVLEERRANVQGAIDLFEWARHLLSYWWVILLCAAIGLGAAGGYSYYILEDIYTSQSMICVNKGTVSIGGSQISLSNLSESVNLANRYTVAVKSRRVLQKAITEYDLDCTYEQLKNMVTVSSVNDTEFLSISVTDSNPRNAQKVANAVTDSMIEIMNTLVEGNNAVILDKANLPQGRSGPNYKKILEMGTLLGAAMGVLFLSILFILDDTIKSEDELYENYNIPLLASIPDHSLRSSGKKYYYYSSEK